MKIREATIEQELIEKLGELKYTLRPDIRDRAAMERNFRKHFEALYKAEVDAWALYDNAGDEPVLLDWSQRP